MQSRLVLSLLVLMVLSVAAISYTRMNEEPVVSGTPTVATTSAAVIATTTQTTTKPVVKPVVKPAATSTPVSQSKEITITAYLTGYAWPDNTPPGSAISNPVLHHEAGGTGTYEDPVTVAVGHSFINGEDILDYAAGTKFYMPYLHKYFIAEDTCGDGDTPQNVPCHNLHKEGNEAPLGAQAWLDLWVGGVGSTQAVVLECENTVTDLHKVLINPAPNYVVNAGAIYDTSCAPQFSDTPTRL